MIDPSAAISFVSGRGRVLDRRRLPLVLGAGDPDAVVSAPDAYRNADGGYGWGLESDRMSLRPSRQRLSMRSKHWRTTRRREANARSSCATGSRTICLDDGGLPFVLPIQNAAGVDVVDWAEVDAARPLDLVLAPGGLARGPFETKVLVAELERLVARQQANGGWTADIRTYSPALEWRDYETLRVAAILQRRCAI